MTTDCVEPTQDERHCEYCGAPLSVSGRVLWDDGHRWAYCSTRCVERGVQFDLSDVRRPGLRGVVLQPARVERVRAAFFRRNVTRLGRRGLSRSDGRCGRRSATVCLDRSGPVVRSRRIVRRIHDQLDHHADRTVQGRGLASQRQQSGQLLRHFVISRSRSCRVRFALG